MAKRLRGERQHGRGQYALVSSRTTNRQECLGDRDRASWREGDGGYGQPPLRQRPLWTHPYLGRGRGRGYSVLQRRAEAQEQHRSRQPLWPQQAGHLLGRDGHRQRLTTQQLQHERTGAFVQLKASLEDRGKEYTLWTLPCTAGWCCGRWARR